MRDLEGLRLVAHLQVRVEAPKQDICLDIVSKLNQCICGLLPPMMVTNVIHTLCN
jgi:hypothetical protein